MEDLSHVDDAGRARMVDVGSKPLQRRRAKARGTIKMAPRTAKLIAENQMKKGDVLSVAQIAGVQAAKRTAELIPLCHPLTLDHISVELHLVEDGVTATAEVRCTGRTGVEKDMRMGDILLLEKVKGDDGNE